MLCYVCLNSGPPGPPVDCQVSEVTETTASLSWGPGLDNHSPIQSYAIQARSPFSLGWQAMTTGRLHVTVCAWAVCEQEVNVVDLKKKEVF